MYHLVYTSHAKRPFIYTQLIELLNQARIYNKAQIYNKAHEITGLLIYCNQKFIQVLEGERDAVDYLYSKIEMDIRHKKVTKVIVGETEERIFKNWSMGFKILEDDAEFKMIEGYQDVEIFFDQLKMTEDSSLVMIFFQLFYKRNQDDYPELAT